MGTNEKVTEDVEDAKHDNRDRAIHGGVYGESKSIEAVVLKWDHEVFSGVPFAVFVETVSRDELGWVPDAARVKHECNDLGKRGQFNLLLIGSLYGANEKIGLEGLKLVGE